MNRLFRSRTDNKITGLCGGLAERLGMDAMIVRLLVIIAACISFGTVAFVYLIASVVVPKAPYGVDNYFGRFRSY
ncbi:PspC domain-containing protein [Paenibacillus contaminans]|uniref:PspC domain-containing protein n=1 Tax=Paenibacillus contaminans TaxID=450362 RepID=A0A329M226_9BACL|nr:PspC domain-containing protein [Paenibacillus contaminans]RAV13642.1 PspC domain-containing protein [Paenibacillus contaminans]